MPSAYISKCRCTGRRGGRGLIGPTCKSFTNTDSKRLVLHEKRASQGGRFDTMWCVHRSRCTTVATHAKTTIRWPSRSLPTFEYILILATCLNRELFQRKLGPYYSIIPRQYYGGDIFEGFDCRHTASGVRWCNFRAV